MGAEREDTDPLKKAGTEPGLGPGTGHKASSGAAKSAAKAAEEPAPVDFDALHAALGDPLDLEELPPAALEMEVEEDTAAAAAAKERKRIGESQGRSSATYSSARPHTIPPTRAPNEDLNAPAVIVASDDTVPTAPPAMTVPLAAARPLAGAPPGSGPHPAAPPSSGPHLAAPGYPHTPQPFPVQRQAQLTMRMAERPARRPKTPTIVVRQRGPSGKQKFLAFAAMLLVVTAFGIGVVFWQKPEWIGLDAKPGSAPSGAPSGAAASTAAAAPSGASASSTAATTATTASTAAAAGTTTSAPVATSPGAASATPVVTAAPPKKPPRPPAPPRTTTP